MIVNDLHFKALVKTIGRPEVRFHDIRHTYSTLAIQSKVDFKTLSSSLGHATVGFTLDTYGHVSNAMKQDAANMRKISLPTPAVGNGRKSPAFVRGGRA